LAHAVQHKRGRPAGIRGWFHHHGITRGQGCPSRAEGQGGGVVEGADHQPYTVGLKRRLVGGAEANQRIAVHLAHETFVSLDLCAGIAHQVGCLCHLAQGFGAIFTDLKGHGSGNFVNAFVDQVSKFT